MWPRFGGPIPSAKRKYRVLEFEECTETASTSTLKRKTNDSLYSNSPSPICRGRAPVIIHQSEYASGSDFEKLAKTPKPICAWPRLKSQKESDQTSNEPEKLEENPRSTTIASAKKEYKFGSKLIEDVELADDIFEEIIDEIGDEKPLIQVDKSNSNDDIRIELSQGNSPKKGFEADIEEDSCRESFSQVPKPLSVESSSSSSLTRPAFFAPRRTVTPPSPQKKSKKKLKGLAAKVSSHLYQKRGERRIKSITPGLAAIDISIINTTRCWGVSSSTLDSGQQLFCRRSTVSASGPASSRLALPLAQVQISSGQAPAILHPIFHYPMMTLVVPYLIFLLSVITQVDAIRCQCSTNRGPIPCYNNWCEVNKKDGKDGACAVIQSGNSRTFACVLVKKDSGDECKVDRVEGRMQARCWCRSSDYCNVDLAERVEEDQEDDDDRQISAEEIATSSSPKQFSAITEPREDFVINAAYVDEDLTQVTYDDGDFSLEDDFPHDIYPIPPVPSSTLKPPIGPTIPPWRREVPASDDRQPPPPPRIPERPDRIPSRPQEKVDRWPERVPERTPEEEEKTRREEQEKYRREWERAMDEYRRRQAEKDPWIPPIQAPVPPPPTPPRRESTTTTIIKRPETSRKPERIPERPRYIEPPTTTSTSKRTEKPTTTSTTSTTTSTTTTTTPPSSPSTESVADAFARVKENQEIARKSYQNHRNRYRVYDFFKTSSTTSSSTSTTSSSTSTTSSSTSTTTSNPSTPPPTTLRTTTIVSTKKETEAPTTRRRTTTTTEKTTTVDSLEEEMEEEAPTNVPEEEKIPENIHRSGQEFKPKTSSLPGYLLALFLIFFL